MNHDDFAGFVLKWLGDKTLADFRSAATKELNGTIYDAVRDDTGRRFIMIVCMTGEHELKKLENIFGPVPNDHPVDWATIPARDVLVFTIEHGGFSYEEERNDRNQRKSLILFAAEPKSVGVLETVLGLK